MSLSPDFKWNLLLDQIEQGRLVPVIGRQLLQVDDGGTLTTFDRWLARRVAASLGNRALADVPLGPSLREVICSHPKAARGGEGMVS